MSSQLSWPYSPHVRPGEDPRGFHHCLLDYQNRVQSSRRNRPCHSSCFLLSWYLAHDTRDCWDNFILPQIQFFWEKLADGGKLGKEMSEGTPVPGFNQKASSRRAPSPGLHGGGTEVAFCAPQLCGGYSSHFGVQKGPGPLCVQVSFVPRINKKHHSRSASGK